MSFGFDQFDREVDEMLESARAKEILVFAAMSNAGTHKEAAWPARSSEDAIGIHSCIDKGTKTSDFTPLHVHGNQNFMTVGEQIMTHWPTRKGGGFRNAQGTSIATPVAASIAALILAFVNQSRCKNDREEYQKRVKVRDLWKNGGMIKLLQEISKPVGDYRWIDPRLLWSAYPERYEEQTADSRRNDAWRRICKALRK
ncbi:hypothetical protein NW767_014625 [Fusarium falciforme]|nr:hypothetical protein NW767_014625 [Fusarium falciforme]